MKTFQKITLAAAISVAPFASQAMEALDDSVLGNTTGQAGVTIELNIGTAGISVEEIEYTDEGSILLQNLTVKNVNDLTVDIDVDTAGNLLVETNAIDGIQVALGSAPTSTGDFSAVALKGTNGTSELVNDLSLELNLGETTVQIMNLAGANALATQAQADGFSADAFTSPVAIRVQSSLEITDLDVGVFGDTRAQAEAKADVDGTPGLSAAEELVADGYATDAAVRIDNIKFYGVGGEGTAATVDAVVWAKNGPSSADGGLYIQLGSIQGTLDIGSIALGGTSIGQVKVSNINLAGLTTRIYGH